MLDFLGIGAQKAGTTWIYDKLVLHPEIDFPQGKELDFFDSHPGKGIAWYKSLFSGNTKKKRGQITPAYALQDVDTIREIYKINPKMRLIYSIRNPIDRAWSSAKMALGRSEMTLNEASDQWFLDHFYSQGSLKRGDYLRCLSNWLEVFPKEQLLIVDYDEIVSNPLKVLTECCIHIGVNPDVFTKKYQSGELSEPVNPGIKSPIRPSLLPVLHQLYDEKMKAFEVVRKRLGEAVSRRQNFVILFEGRTGSSMLTELLASHPCMISEPERLVRKSEGEQSGWMEQLYTDTPNPMIQAVGFKTKLRDVANPDYFLELLEKHHVKVIYLHRENLVKMALSRINAIRLFEDRKLWNLLPGQSQLPPIAIPVQQFDESLRFRLDKEQKLQSFLNRLSVPVLDLTYEMLLASPQTVFDSIFTFLDVVPYPLEGKYKKNTPDNLREAIINFDELKAHYQGTEFEAMFDKTA